MKVKLFSHKSDPDGLGSAILASLVYGENLSVTLFESVLELDERFRVFIQEKEYTDFDKIFITDLCPRIEYLEKIVSCEELAEKILIFDHHEFVINQLDKKYAFLTEKKEDNGNMCCGTSLFYHYLVKSEENILLKKKSVETFVELTRLHDTYEWKKENNVDAYSLQILFQYLGCFGYQYHFVKKLWNEEDFSYTKEEQIWITEQIKKNQKVVEKLYENIVIKEKEGICLGIALANYEYRNLLADYIAEQNEQIDVLLLLAGDEARFSFRSINKEIDVNEMAQLCGGGGHVTAAGGKLNKENFQKILFFLK